MNTQELLHELEKHLIRAESYAQMAYYGLSEGNPDTHSVYCAWRNAQAASKVVAELRNQMEGVEIVRQESEA